MGRIAAAGNMFVGDKYISFLKSLSCSRKASIEDSIIGNVTKDARVVQSPANSEETVVNKARAFLKKSQNSACAKREEKPTMAAPN